MFKKIILNCFANLELQRDEYSPDSEMTDDEIVYSCYHSLPSTNDTAKKVKEKYLTAVITPITMYTQCEYCFPIHHGTTYKQKVKEWKKAKFVEYVSATEIDLYQVRKDLYADFDRMVKTAEKGAFEKEDKEYHEGMRKFLFQLIKKTLIN